MVSHSDKDSKLSQATVIGGKLSKPRVPENLVQRELVTTLSQRIIEGIRAALIIAPAGYGKSILLSQTSDQLTAKGYNCYWLSIDNKDNDPLRFLSHLNALVNPQESTPGQLASSFFGSERKSAIDYLIADIANDLEKQDCPQAIFIDDYHAISNPEVLSILERLILYSPQQTVFVIASRTEPGLALNALKVREEIFQLTRKDLAFVLDESEKFLNSCKQLGLGSKLVSALAERTEGWVAGLQLASLALVGNSDYEKVIDEFTGTDRDVTDYLGEVILARQTDEVRRFLLWTSPLERMSAELVNQVLGMETGQAMLELLEEKSLFVIPLDRQRSWYRYHHLFGDFLRNTLDKEYPGVAEKNCRRAYSWCVDNGYNHEAINYALSTKDYRQALDLIAHISRELILVHGENWTLLNWVKQFPDGYVLNRPIISLSYCWTLVFSRQYVLAREQIDMLARYCDEHADTLKPERLKELRGGIKLILCLIETACDNSERARDLLKEWLDESPSTRLQDFLSIYVLQSYNSLATFDIELAQEAANNAIACAEQLSIGYMSAWAHAVGGMSAIARADLHEAEKQYKKGLSCNSKDASEFSYMGSLNTVLLAEVYYERNEVDKAEELLDKRFEYVDSEAAVKFAYAGYRIMANIQRLKNGLDAALDILHLGQESAERAELPRLQALLAGEEIRHLLQSGKRKEAQIIAKDFGFDESGSPGPGHDTRHAFQEIRELVRAELSLYKNMPKMALGILNDLIAQCEETGRERRLIELLSLRGWALHELRRTNDAEADIIRALEIAEKTGFYRRFLDAGNEVHQLLRLVVKHDTSKQADSVVEFLGKINGLLLAEHANKTGETSLASPTNSLLEPMTKRERQMLDMIAVGETNKDIADKLFISEQTVKWHLHQLYKKLGVKNRTSAIAKARALSLI